MPPGYVGPIPLSSVAPPADALAVVVRTVGGGGGGGGVVQQGARDATAQAWLVDASGTPIALDAATLAALETINVGNAIALDAATLAALEVIGLDAATLAALETVTVANLLNPHPVTGPLTDAQLRATAVPVSMGAGAAMTWVSAKTAAPAIGAVQADTGQLAAGDYDFDVQLAVSDTVAVGKGLVLEHRNAANGATLFNLGGCAPTASLQIQLRRYTIALNERLRVIAGTAAGAAASMYVSAIGRRLS